MDGVQVSIILIIQNSLRLQQLQGEISVHLLKGIGFEDTFFHKIKFHRQNTV